MEQEFISFIKKTAKTPEQYLIIGGDLIENGTRSSVGDSIFTQNMSPSEQKEEMIKILEPVKDRILCFVQGNHERRSRKDADCCPLFDIAAKLDLEHLYREDIAFVSVGLGSRITPGGALRKGTERPTYMLVVTHGTGGGIYTGSSLNRNDRFGYVIDGMDVLFTGHVHKPFTDQPAKIKIDPYNKKVSIVPFKTVSASSWLEYGGYSAQKMLSPSSFCLTRVKLYHRNKRIEVTM